MEHQIYYNQKEKIEVYIVSGSTMIISTIHPLNKHQIISIPETRTVRGTKKDEENMKNELLLQINRNNAEQIVSEIMNSIKAHIYSALP